MTQKKTTTKKEPPTPVIQDIQGKPYEIVASRQKRFRYDHPIESGWGLIVNIVHMDEATVVMECQVKNPEGVIVAQDYAEEKRKGMVNSTSAMENGSTSAQGRALCQAGYNATDSPASFEEVENAISQQTKTAAKPKTAPKRVTSETALANDRQKTEIRAAFKGLSASASKELRKELLIFAKIKLPEGLSTQSFRLDEVDQLLTEKGAEAFLRRPTF